MGLIKRIATLLEALSPIEFGGVFLELKIRSPNLELYWPIEAFDHTVVCQAPLPPNIVS